MINYAYSDNEHTFIYTVLFKCRIIQLEVRLFFIKLTLMIYILTLPHFSIMLVKQIVKY